MSAENIAASVAAAAVNPHPAAVQPPPAAAAVTVAATTAAQTAAAVVTPTPTPTSTAITVTPEQWAAFTSTQTRLAELEAAEQKRTADARDAEINALRAKGEIKQAFELQRSQAQAELDAERKKLRDTEERAKRYALDGELGRALAGHQLVTGGAEHLTRLLRDDLQVEAQGDSFVVRSKDFRPVGEYIGAMLGRPEYSCFVRAQNPGGGTAGGTTVQSTHTQAANPAAVQQPRSMGEAILAGMLAAKKDQPDPRLSGGTVLRDDGAVSRQAAAAFGLKPWRGRRERIRLKEVAAV